MPAHPIATVSVELALHLVVPGRASLPVPTLLRYEADDPYAVHLGFRTGGDEVVEWTFARQLLADGLVGAVGDGDVRVWPAGEDSTGASARLVCLALSSPSGTARFELPADRLVDFLTRTYAAVPAGGEARFVDLDAELALLLWGATDA